MKCKIRIRLKGSEVEFNPMYEPGTLVVMDVMLDKEPKSLDEVMQQIKMKVLHKMFEIDYIVEDNPFMGFSRPVPYIQ